MMQDWIAIKEKFKADAAESQRQLDALNTLIDAIDEYVAVVSPKPEVRRFRVKSRSLGPPHYVTKNLSDNTFSCTCEASKRNLECWALKGVRNVVGIYSLRTGDGGFYDEHGSYRTYEDLGEE